MPASHAKLQVAATPDTGRLHLLDYPAARAEDAFTAMRVLHDRCQADNLYCMILSRLLPRA